MPRAGAACAGLGLLMVLMSSPAWPSTPQLEPVVPKDKRGQIDAERSGTHDAANIRTVFWNYGMVGDYPPDPGNVDLSVFHSAEAPKGSGMNYTDGITPFVLAKVRDLNGIDTYIMETGYRERQAISPTTNRMMRFEPRPGYFEADPTRNVGRSPAISNDPRTWPAHWPDRDSTWDGYWNGYFGKLHVADQESYTVMDDDAYDAFEFDPDSRDPTRRGLGLRVEVRGFQWSNPQASNVIFWHYEIVNEGTTDYDDNIIFGLYMDSGVGGSALSCDQIYESDDDNAYWDKSFPGLNLVYTWDVYGHGVDVSSNCGKTGYLGYAYLETPGNAFDGIDNDGDGVTDERRDTLEVKPVERVVGQDAIRSHVQANYDLAKFEAFYGPLENRPAYKTGVWWVEDEDMDWVAEFNDVGYDGIFGTADRDSAESNGRPDQGEPNFGKTDLNESDQIGLTGFKMNRIRAGQGNPDPTTDGILFYTESQNWPSRLFQKWTDPYVPARFDSAVAANYNIGFLFASGPFKLKAGARERFSLALAYGADLQELRENVHTVQLIYNANYRFAVPPLKPTVSAEAGDGWVRLTWDDVAERSVDPVTGDFDFEGYRIYRSTDPEFRDPRVITTGRGTGPIGNGKPIAQFDLVDGKRGFTRKTIEGVAYDLGSETGITHTWTDDTVTNGQEYYYAVCAYDYGYDPGNDSLAIYPSENSITVSRTPRSGLILPSNVAAVRPNPRVAGYEPATVETPAHVAGRGVGSVAVQVVNSNLVPDGHVFKLGFTGLSEDNVRADRYTLTDTTASPDRVLFTTGADLDGLGIGPAGAGLLPVIRTPRVIAVDSSATGWEPGGATGARVKVTYQPVLDINQRRLGFPEDFTIEFSETVLDTGLAIYPVAATPAKFRVTARTAAGDLPLDFRFEDRNGDSTLSLPDPRGDRLDIVTYTAAQPGVPQITWRVQVLDTLGPTPPNLLPRSGDDYQFRLLVPYGPGDVFTFRAGGQRVDPALAREQARQAPYVVPNPYVGAASFEPARYAVSGRGERRVEFRALPLGAVIRIYTVKGDLVQTLRHDGSNDGFVAWDLRTRDNLDVAPGLYVFQVEAPGVESHVGKFAVIK